MDPHAHSKPHSKSREPRSILWWLAAIVISSYLATMGTSAAMLIVRIFPSSNFIVSKIDASPTANSDGTGPRNVDSDLRSENDGILAARVQLRTEFPAISTLGYATAIPPEQGYVLLALLSGVVGSALHALQSFSVYLGKRRFYLSWTLWYLYRPLIGGILGLLLYFVIRAGLMGAANDAVSPYGVVAYGGLAGLFAKQAVEKLAELFATLFRTAGDERIDHHENREDLRPGQSPEASSSSATDKAPE